MANDKKYHIKGRDSMKTIDVIFVSDELVGSTIVSKKDYERLMRQKQKAEVEKTNSQENNEVVVDVKTAKRKANEDISESDSKKSKYVDDVELALAALENDDVEKLDLSHPSTLYDEEDISVKKIFNFQNNTNSLKTPKSVNYSKSKLDKSVNKQDKVSQSNKKDSQTPNNSRNKVIKDIKEIQKILENSDDDFSGSDSDSSFRLSDDSLSDGRESINPSEQCKTKSYFENYCDLQSTKKSKHGTAVKKLKTSKLTQEKLDELFKNIQISLPHKDSIKTLLADTVSLFDKWDFILRQNYNLLLYGAGSKREVIGKFVERLIDIYPIIVINGFFPDISCKEILDSLCRILKMQPDTSDVVDSIRKKIKQYDIRIYLAINNIDGVMLRSPKVQNTLSQLGKIEEIYIIASIDHINGPLIWNKSTCSELNWIWFDCTSFLSYTEETVYEGNLMLQSTGKTTLTSLRNVFNSLTKNSRGIFMILVKNQLESGNKSGMSFRELYQKSRNELLISSDVALRTQLKEFIDHLVLKQKRTADGEEQFVILVENSILKQFLEEQETQQS